MEDKEDGDVVTVTVVLPRSFLDALLERVLREEPQTELGPEGWSINVSAAGLQIVMKIPPRRDPEPLTRLMAQVDGPADQSARKAQTLPGRKREEAGNGGPTPVASNEFASRSTALADTHQPEVRLSAREWDVLEPLAQGLSNSKVAEALGISRNTVKSHVRRIMAALRTTNRTQTALLGGLLLQKRLLAEAPLKVEPGET